MKSNSSALSKPLSIVRSNCESFPCRFPLVICHSWDPGVGHRLQTLGAHTPWICVSVPHKYRVSL